jgi:hypothetical protein
MKLRIARRVSHRNVCRARHRGLDHNSQCHVAQIAVSSFFRPNFAPSHHIRLHSVGPRSFPTVYFGCPEGTINEVCYPHKDEYLILMALCDGPALGAAQTLDLKDLIGVILTFVLRRYARAQSNFHRCSAKPPVIPTWPRRFALATKMDWDEPGEMQKVRKASTTGTPWMAFRIAQRLSSPCGRASGNYAGAPSCALGGSGGCYE